MIGDPSTMGWLTVAGYFAAALLCFRASRRANQGEPRLWLGLGLCLLVLGVNKQLDLQSLFTQIARDHALAHGWYPERAYYQRLFVTGLAAAGSAALILLYWQLRRRPWPIRAALLGFTLLALFVAGRAASFHHVDRFIKTEFIGLRWNWILELGGILVIAGAAFGARTLFPVEPRPQASHEAPHVRDLEET